MQNNFEFDLVLFNDRKDFELSNLIMNNIIAGFFFQVKYLNYSEGKNLN